eukprot:6173962-Pleurochrysis_carterae.AAC.2
MHSIRLRIRLHGACACLSGADVLARICSHMPVICAIDRCAGSSSSSHMACKPSRHAQSKNGLYMYLLTAAMTALI